MTDTTGNIEDWQVRAELAEAALGRAQAENDAKLIRAELKAEAIRAGMVDLDGLKLINIDDVHLTDTGELAEAADLMVKLKRTKPWLFGKGVSSSAAANPPRPDTPRERHANELNHDEWMAARAALLRRR